MSRIVVLIREQPLSTSMLKGLSALLNRSVMQIKNAVTEKRPVLDMEIFDHGYEEKANLLRQLVDRLRRDKIAVEIYELLGDEAFEPGKTPDGSKISMDVLERILESADEDGDHPR